MIWDKSFEILGDNQTRVIWDENELVTRATVKMIK